jgi:hypothetical protein
MPMPLDLDAVSLEDLKKLVVQLMVEVTALREVTLPPCSASHSA